MPAFDGCDIAYVTTLDGYRPQVSGARFYVVNDASRWNKVGLLLLAVRLFRIVRRERPDVIVSTGAAPGYIGIRIGKLLGATTIWVDSMANVENMSMSGQRVAKHADLWLTQWPHLAKPEGPSFEGAVL
jgi:UDP-N-acetylglucosamine:LPS N-acetylglucosamine transferase